MKFNKKELFKLTVGKFFLFALLALFLVSQTVQANDADVDMNALDFHQMKVPLTTQNVTMPQSALSQAMVHPTRPVEAIYAGFIRDSVRNALEAKKAIDGVVTNSRNSSFALGDGAEQVEQLKSLAVQRRKNMESINSYYDNVITGYHNDAEQAIKQQLASTYQAAITDRTSSISEKITTVHTTFNADKVAPKGYAESAMLALRSTLDSTYSGLLSGTLNAATLGTMIVTHKVSTSTRQ